MSMAGWTQLRQIFLRYSEPTSVYTSQISWRLLLAATIYFPCSNPRRIGDVHATCISFFNNGIYKSLPTQLLCIDDDPFEPDLMVQTQRQSLSNHSELRLGGPLQILMILVYNLNTENPVLSSYPFNQPQSSLMPLKLHTNWAITSANLR